MATHKLVCGDVFNVLSQHDADTFHAAIIDYPWEINITTGDGEKEFRNAPRGADKGCRDKESDDVMFNLEPVEKLDELFTEISRVVVDGGYIISFADDQFQDPLRNVLQQHDTIIFRRNWAWNPNRIGMGYYGRVNHYPIPVATNGKTDRYVTDRGTLYSTQKRNENDYPTSKPIELYRKLLNTPVLETGEALLEPFCGTAPGLAIAKEREIDYLGIDSNTDAITQAQSQYNQQQLSAFTNENDTQYTEGLETFMNTTDE